MSNAPRLHLEAQRKKDIFYRVADGLAAMGMARIEGERLTNEFHFSKELIANSYSSFMVPKYSPLKVWGKI